MEDLELTKEWDKIFPKSYKVNHSKVTFRNRYGITLAADMYTPKNINGKMAAIAISIIGKTKSTNFQNEKYKKIAFTHF